MDLQYGDNEEPFAAAISICVVDSGYDPGADPTQVRHQTQRGIGGPPSFRPKGQIAELRAYVRQRERLLEYAASHIQHMQKALTEMNVQLHHVVADITGATGLRIIRAILAGERDPESWRVCAITVATLRC